MREPASATQIDLVRKPVSALLWWAAPIAIGAVLSRLGLDVRMLSEIWAILFAWMGTGCALNARACHRLHCYISAPVFFAGALGAILYGRGVLPLGPHALDAIIATTFCLAVLSFVPEGVWGKYA
jgi:hypothetical protein